MNQALIGQLRDLKRSDTQDEGQYDFIRRQADVLHACNCEPIGKHRYAIAVGAGTRWIEVISTVLGQVSGMPTF